MNFKDKIVFITGAGGGFGRAAAERLAESGARLVLADMNADLLESAKEAVVKVGGDCVAIACDVSDEDSVAAAVQGGVEQFGTIDIAVNNAGVTHSLSRLADLDTAELDRQLAVNIRGVFLCMKYQLPVMLQHGGGSIVNLSSVAGLTGTFGLSAYSASKHAVIGLTKSAAVEYASKGIRINALCPATIDSPMMRQTTAGTPTTADDLAQGIPMKRLGGIHEVVNGIMWLASDESSFVTGHAMALDGGFTAQ